MSRPTAPWTPAMRDGVSASRVAVHGGPWTSVLQFMTARFAMVDDWPQRFNQGEVLNTFGANVQADDLCIPGAIYWYWRQPPPEPRVPFELTVLHQCEHLVAIDKPHFLAAVPSGRHLHETALVRVKKLLGIASLVPMHRLDRETAGVMLFIVRPQERHAYQALLRERRVHKVYEAIAAWRDGLQWPLDCRLRLEEPQDEAFMQMRVVPGEPNAETRIDLLSLLHPAVNPATSVTPVPVAHYRLTPRTGKRHQLRVQMNALGLPIVGDRIYPRLWPEAASGETPDHSQPLQLLAREFSFLDPFTGERRQFVSLRKLAMAEVAETPMVA